MLEYIKAQIRSRYETWCDVESITIDPESEIIVNEIDCPDTIDPAYMYQRLQLSLKIFYTVTARCRFLTAPLIHKNNETFMIPHLFQTFIYQRDCNDLRPFNRPTDSRPSQPE